MRGEGNNSIKGGGERILIITYFIDYREADIRLTIYMNALI